MEQQKQVPSTMKVEIGGVEYTYELKEKEEKVECQFEIGDIVFEYASGFLSVAESLSDGWVHSSRRLYDKFIHPEIFGPCGSIKEFTKATPEQERLFNQKCLENGFWFDRENKKWIELKEGEVYYINFDQGLNCTIIFKEIYNGDICDHCYYNGKAVCKLIISENATGSIKAVINISEATEEEEKQLFATLEKHGKQWNKNKICMEDLRWEPKIGEKIWYFNNSFDVCSRDYGTYMRKFIEMGNCFKTEEEAEKYAQYMRECSLNYKPE